MLSIKQFLIIFIVGVAVAALSAYIIYKRIPHVCRSLEKYPVLYYRGPEQPVLVEFKTDRPQGWVPLERISQEALGAIVASEDYSFYGHHGVDWAEFELMIRTEWLEGKSPRGVSTITQQLAKNLFLTHEKTLLRKLREMVLAHRIETCIAKSTILEYYMNIVEWGQGIYGINAASRYYFHKSPAALQAKEGAFLAMLLPNPKKNATSFKNGKLTPYAQKTVYRIMEKMISAHYLTYERFDALKNIPLSFEKNPQPYSPKMSEDSLENMHDLEETETPAATPTIETEPPDEIKSNDIESEFSPIPTPVNEETP